VAVKEVGQVGNQTALRGDEERATENLQGNHSNDCHGFLTILDNILTVGESTGSEEQAGWPNPNPGGLLEDAGKWVKIAWWRGSLRCFSSDMSHVQNA
jgi:hypothetical protein